MIVKYKKNVGETMTQLINRFMKEYNITDKKRVTYAGRLDPLAFGYIYFLTDADKKDDIKYCHLDKIYEVNIIEGILTDTYDIMGITVDGKKEGDIKDLLNNEYKQKYPSYSSKTVKVENKMMPLWQATKRGLKYNQIEQPTKLVKLYNAEQLETYFLNKTELLKLINDRISKVTIKTFRQDEILKLWNTIQDREYKITKWRFHISSGGYIRYIANYLGGIAYDINRIHFL